MAAVGLELLFSSVQNQIKSQHDALMCCLHWHMLNNGFKVLSIGETVPDDVQTCKGSEILPSGWNESQDVYNLIYRDNKSECYLLKCLKMDMILLVHIMRFSDEKVCNLSLEVENFVSSQITSFDSAFVNLEQLARLFQVEVTEKLFATKSEKQTHNKKVKQEANTSKSHDPDDPLRDNRSQHRRPVEPGWDSSNDPFSLGRRDLDPLAAGRGIGGGMVMDPFHGGFPGGPGGFDPSSGLPGPRLPRGAVPPGARFDPFGPPDPDSPFGRPRPPRSGPDPDHMRPPGYDDMFM